MIIGRYICINIQSAIPSIEIHFNIGSINVLPYNNPFVLSLCAKCKYVCSFSTLNIDRQFEG